MLIFVIPIRHPDNVRDKARQMAYLSQTVASIAAQTSQSFKAVIVANPGQDLPDLPPQFIVEWVDFPVNKAIQSASDRAAVYASIRQDKGKRIRAALRHAQPQDAIMVVDDDDLISCRIVDFYQERGNTGAYVMDRGYLWSDGDKVMTETDSFNELCGTSLIIPVHYFAETCSADISEDMRVAELGSHKLIFERHPKNTDFQKVPFRAAVYRQGHSNASQIDLRKVVRRANEAGGLLKKAIMQGNYRGLWNKFWKVSGFGKGRQVNLDAALLQEFFGQVQK